MKKIGLYIGLPFLLTTIVACSDTCFDCDCTNSIDPNNVSREYCESNSNSEADFNILINNLEQDSCVCVAQN